MKSVWIALSAEASQFLIRKYKQTSRAIRRQRTRRHFVLSKLLPYMKYLSFEYVQPLIIHIVDSSALTFKMATARAHSHSHVDPVERLKEEHKAWKHNHPKVGKSVMIVTVVRDFFLQSIKILERYCCYQNDKSSASSDSSCIYQCKPEGGI